MLGNLAREEDPAEMRRDGSDTKELFENIVDELRISGEETGYIEG